MAHAAGCGSQRDITSRSQELTLNDMYLIIYNVPVPWAVSVSGGQRCALSFLIWALFMETVLIIEDDVMIRDILIKLIGKDGREIATAADGQEALERLMEIPRPSLILLDLMMPRINGWEFLRRQSADPSIAGIPTIVLSGSRLPTGARHQLAKPIDVGRLLALVDQYC